MSMLKVTTTFRIQSDSPHLEFIRKAIGALLATADIHSWCINTRPDDLSAELDSLISQHRAHVMSCDVCKRAQQMAPYYGDSTKGDGCPKGQQLITAITAASMRARSS